MLIEFIILAITIVLFSVFLHRKPKGLPPGEWGLPVVGYVPFMSLKMSETFEKLEKKHGKIFSLKLGVLTVIVTTDYSFIKEAYSKAEISGRPLLYAYKVLKKYDAVALVHSSGHVWITNRRFALKTLRDFGLGKSKLEEFILAEANYLVKDLKENVNQPCSIDWNLNVAILNVIWRLVADRRYNINDKDIMEFSKYTTENLKDTEGPMAILNFFPWLIPILPKYIKNSWMKINLVEEKRTRIYKFLTDIIEEHKKALDPKDPRDFIDKYLIELAEQKDNPEYAHFGEADLLVSVYEFFLAGSDTTATTLRWFFLYMMKYPDVQKRVQKEIDEVMPRDKLPSMEDKHRLPCLEALSYEINRVVSLLPNGFPHEVLEDVELFGFLLPKGSLVLPNVESIHRNPKYWDHPNEFALENFLNSEGKFVPKKEGYIPFSIGRRQCLGESMAKMELFLFMGAILQNFDISKPQGENISLTPETDNIFNFPPKFNVVLKNRV